MNIITSVSREKVKNHSVSYVNLAGTSYPTADNNRYKFPDKNQVTFNLADFIKLHATRFPTRLQPIFKLPDSRLLSGKPKLPDFLNIKIPEIPTLISKLAEFPDDSRLKLPDYCREMFKLPDNRRIFSIR